MHSHISHVILLMMENRSFDHLFGFLQTEYPPGTFHGLSGAETNPDDAGTQVPVSNTAAARLDVDPDHTHESVMWQLTGMESRPSSAPLTNSGFVKAYARATGGDGHGVMRCFAPSHVPVLTGLAKAFAVCDHWFCSVPGQTWPNRNYVHSATSDGEVENRNWFFENRTVFELLEEAGHAWTIYHRGPPQVWAFPNLWQSPLSRSNRFRPLDELCDDIKAGRMATYTFVEPDHGLLWPKHRSNSQHPSRNTRDGRDFFDGEQLILDIYAALVATPEIWNRTLFMVTYDEHGGLYDAVAPPRGVPPAVPPDSKSKSEFHFDLLGPRVPAVLISPWIPAGTVDSTTYDHSAIPASLRERFAPPAPALTRRDAVSMRFWNNLSMAHPRQLSDVPDPALLQAQLDAASAGGVTVNVVGIAGAGEPNQLDDFQRSLLEIAMRVDFVLRTGADPYTADEIYATFTHVAAPPLASDPQARIAYLEDLERRFRGEPTLTR